MNATPGHQETLLSNTILLNSNTIQNIWYNTIEIQIQYYWNTSRVRMNTNTLQLLNSHEANTNKRCIRNPSALGDTSLRTKEAIELWRLNEDNTQDTWWRQSYILKVGVLGDRTPPVFFHFPPKFRLRMRNPLSLQWIRRQHCQFSLNHVQSLLKSYINTHKSYFVS